MKKSIIFFIEVIGDIVRLMLFYIRFFLHGKVKFPIKNKEFSQIDILGNGPSLKAYIENDNIDKIDAVCVNFSPLTEEFYQIKPRYLVLIDHAFFVRSEVKVQELSKVIKEKVTWQLSIVINKSHLTEAEYLFGCPNVQFVILPQIVFEPKTTLFIKLKYNFFSKGLTMPSAQNVAIAAIFTAINAGYKNICLFGLEHSWLVDTYVSKENVPCLRDKHYYGVKDVPWAFNSDGTPWKMYQVLDALSLVFKGYCDLQTYANYLGGIRIINKAEGSWIDAFERGE